jgi:hypothetical protein
LNVAVYLTITKFWQSVHVLSFSLSQNLTEYVLTCSLRYAVSETFITEHHSFDHDQFITLAMPSCILCTAVERLMSHSSSMRRIEDIVSPHFG